ncbi:MAG: phosphate ABC transporter substrate-binding protein [Candidatus Omnitrophota bacterium]|jgi:phosphate transport system substrate-binding protein
MNKIMLKTLTAIFVLGSAFNLFAAESNSITIKGSTTVLPIAQRTAEEFMKKNSSINISVQGGGSSVGIASIIDGTTDIADSSRPIKDKELDKAVSMGVSPKANVVAMDGIAVIVNPSNTINNMTKQQISNIYIGKTSNWSNLGGSSGKIVVISRDNASGTFEAFTEKALDKQRTRPDALSQASNQAVVQTVSSTPGAIGYIGLGYISDKVKSVTVNGVECTKETVLSGEYLLARPLFMYTNGRPKGVVKDYLDFVLSAEGQSLIEKEGYVGLK